MSTQGWVMVCGAVTPLFALARGYCDQTSTWLQQTLLRSFLPSTWEEKNSARGHVSFTNSSWWPLLPALGILTVAENFVSCKAVWPYWTAAWCGSGCFWGSTFLCKQIASKSGVNSSVRESFLTRDYRGVASSSSEVSIGDWIQQADG